jgi:hypothetical protein
VILLKKTITGPRGRGLMVAPEAKAKGYIQHMVRQKKVWVDVGSGSLPSA